jgi:hypothetical protein
MPKQVTKPQSFNSSTANRIFLVSIIIAITVIIGGLLTYAPDHIKRSNLESALSKAGMATSWNLVHEKADPSGFWATCGPLLDTPCPQLNAQYNLKSGKTYSKALADSIKAMQDAGFNVKSCTTQPQNCVNYFIKANHGGVSLSITVDKKDTSTAHVHIEED